MKKKIQQKISQKAVKAARDIIQSQIPPYPRWVKYLFWMWTAYTGLLILMPPLTIRVIYAVTIIWLFLFLVVSGYGIYRAFRHFTERAILASGILFGLAVLFLLKIWVLPLGSTFATILDRCAITYRNSRSFIFVLLSGVMITHGLVAIFWKPMRKMGWFIFYFGLLLAVAISGQFFDYVTIK